MYIILKCLWYLRILQKLNIFVDFVNLRYVFFINQIEDFDNIDIE